MFTNSLVENNMMKAVVVTQHGSPDVLIPQDVIRPEPKTGDVLVRNQFIGVNFVDTQHRAGGYYPVQLPLIPGIEAAGTVAAIGAEVTDFQVGDRVAFAGYMAGVYAEYSAVPQTRLVKVPPELPLENAAACLMTGLTAAVLIQEVHPLRQNDVVLIHAAAGGVGLALVQLARQAGARVIGITSSEAKTAAVRAAGADWVFVSGEALPERDILEVTNGQGVHVIFDGVGGIGLEANLSLLRTRGHLVEFGQSGGRPLPLDITRLSGITGTNNRGSLSITWASAGDYLTETETMRTLARTVFDSVISGSLCVTIADRYPLDAAAEADRALERRSVVGKLILTVEQRSR